MSDTPGVASVRPPRDDLVRAVRTGGALRAPTPIMEGEPSRNANGMPTLFGYFARFEEWAEIDSLFEGHFMERILPGAFKKTFREQTPKVLFQHGTDPQIGDKPLGAPIVLREDPEGPYYEVPLLDTSYNRDLVPGLEAGLYGASFRFSVMREDWDDDPAPSEANPNGLPERSIKEVRNAEFGPVTFPAYPGASAAVRSMTDEYLAARMTSQPERLRALLGYLEARDKQERERVTQNDTEEQQAVEDRIVLETAAAIMEAETGAPGTPTPLRSSRKAAPGTSPTPLYPGKSKKKRGWVL